MRLELTDAGPLKVKAVSGRREFLAAVSGARPVALLVQNGLIPPQVVRAARELAELTLSRKVPVVVFGGPLDEATEKIRENVGIREVVDGIYRLQPVIDALKRAVAWSNQAKKTEQIRERLRQASGRMPSYRPATPDSPGTPGSAPVAEKPAAPSSATPNPPTLSDADDDAIF